MSSQQSISYDLAILTAGRNPRLDSSGIAAFVNAPASTTLASSGFAVSQRVVSIVVAMCFTGSAYDTTNNTRNRRAYIVPTTAGYSDELRLSIDGNDSDFTGSGSYASAKAWFEAWATQIEGDLGSGGSVSADEIVSATVEGSDDAPVLVVECTGAKQIDSSIQTGSTAEWTVYRDAATYSMTLYGRLSSFGGSSTDPRAAAIYSAFEPLEGQETIAIGDVQAGRGRIYRRLFPGVDQVQPIVASVTGVSGEAADGTTSGVTVTTAAWVAVVPCVSEGTV